MSVIRSGVSEGWLWQGMNDANKSQLGQTGSFKRVREEETTRCRSRCIGNKLSFSRPGKNGSFQVVPAYYRQLLFGTRGLPCQISVPLRSTQQITRKISLDQREP